MVIGVPLGLAPSDERTEDPQSGFRQRRGDFSNRCAGWSRLQSVAVARLLEGSCRRKATEGENPRRFLGSL